MVQQLDVDLCIIGAGSGGLSVAAAAAQFGERVVLVERAEMGGDCLNYGCVPSKAMIAAAKQAHAMGAGAKFGVEPQPAKVNFRKVHEHIRGVIAAIEPNDSIARFTGLGVKVIKASGKFKDPKTLTAGGYDITARRFVVATGSAPGVPPIEGLAKVKYLTNETIFDLTRQPRHLIVIGGGPIGMELAQAYCRLGSKVTVLEMFAPLARNDPELARIVLDQVAADGVDIRSGIKVVAVAKHRSGIRVEIERDGAVEKIDGSHLLIAAGRRPNVDGLGLKAAGVEYSPHGIQVTRGLKTTNRAIYAIGDVTGSLQFTHMANYHAGLVIRNALFRMPVKVNTAIIPWVIFTDPELAHVGLDESAAAENYREIRVLRWPFAENDRAQAERRTNGLIKVITTRRGRVLGAAIAGHNAGELIHPWSLAVSSGLNIKAMTAMVAPYPTLGEINKRVAYAFYAPSLNNPWLRRLIRVAKAFG